MLWMNSKSCTTERQMGRLRWTTFSTPPKLSAKAHHDLGALREQASLLREPHSKAMGEGLFELRIRQGSNIVRAFYFFFVGRTIVVTNGFVKKTQKTPRREIARALAYKADWEERFDNGRSR